MIDVPCEDCHLCCTHKGIKLEDGDFDVNGDPRFIVMPELDGDRHVLGYRDDLGMCVYLSENGCAIHNDKPMQCKAFDCRKLAVMFSKEQMIDFDAKGYFPMEWWEKGRERILNAGAT